LFEFFFDHAPPSVFNELADFNGASRLVDRIATEEATRAVDGVGADDQVANDAIGGGRGIVSRAVLGACTERTAAQECSDVSQTFEVWALILELFRSGCIGVHQHHESLHESVVTQVHPKGGPGVRDPSRPHHERPDQPPTNTNTKTPTLLEIDRQI